MARTRTEISDLVILNTGRSDKTTLINEQCDSALKIAMSKHPFSDALHICDDVTITEDATSVSIASLEESAVSVGTILDVLTARIVQADGTSNRLLSIKNRQWWDRNVVNPEDNQKGWPVFGLKFGTNIILDRPAESNLELRLRVSAVPAFASDSTECPIETLDVFIEQYVTAMVYLSLGMNDKYVSWYIMALGRDYDRGRLGGTLLNCVQKDKSLLAEDKNVERGSSMTSVQGTSIKNLTSGMETYGDTNTWY